MSGPPPSNTLQVFADHARFCSGQSCKQALFAPIGVFQNMQNKLEAVPRGIESNESTDPLASIGWVQNRISRWRPRPCQRTCDLISSVSACCGIRPPTQERRRWASIVRRLNQANPDLAGQNRRCPLSSLVTFAGVQPKPASAPGPNIRLRVDDVCQVPNFGSRTLNLDHADFGRLTHEEMSFYFV